MESTNTPSHSVFREGVLAGLIGATSVAAWFFVIDLIGGHPLQTPTALGHAFFSFFGSTPMKLDTMLKPASTSLFATSAGFAAGFGGGGGLGTVTGRAVTRGGGAMPRRSATHRPGPSGRTDVPRGHSWSDMSETRAGPRGQRRERATTTSAGSTTDDRACDAS